MTVPPAGRASPARILVSVVFPAPLRPTRPMRSPAADPEGDVVHQQARTGAHLELGDSDQDRAFEAVGSTPPHGAGPAGYVEGRVALVYEATDGRKDTHALQPEGQDRPEPDRDPQRRRPRRWRHAAAHPGGGGGGGRIGIGTIVVIVLFVVLTQCMGVDILGGGIRPAAGTGPRANECQTGEDANKSDACAIDLFTTSVQNYWKQAYPERDGRARTRSSRPCASRGRPTPGAGRPAPRWGRSTAPTTARSTSTPTFFDDMLEGQLGAEGGPFAIGYVVAHEYGHHVEDQLGVLGQIRTQKGPKSDAVRVELMADCLAGVWAKGAQETKDAGRAADHRGAEPGRHQARHRRRPGRGRRPDPEAQRRAGGHRLVHPRLGRAAGALVQQGDDRRARSRAATPSPPTTC